jgi:hypothetical protein
MLVYLQLYTVKMQIQILLLLQSLIYYPHQLIMRLLIYRKSMEWYQTVSHFLFITNLLFYQN